MRASFDRSIFWAVSLSTCLHPIVKSRHNLRNLKAPTSRSASPYSTERKVSCRVIVTWPCYLYDVLSHRSIPLPIRWSKWREQRRHEAVQSDQSVAIFFRSISIVPSPLSDACLVKETTVEIFTHEREFTQRHRSATMSPHWPGSSQSAQTAVSSLSEPALLSRKSKQTHLKWINYARADQTRYPYLSRLIQNEQSSQKHFWAVIWTGYQKLSYDEKRLWATESKFWSSTYERITNPSHKKSTKLVIKLDNGMLTPEACAICRERILSVINRRCPQSIKNSYDRPREVNKQIGRYEM